MRAAHPSQIPGYRLVEACLKENVQIEVLPGPSAVITGLVGSGLPTDRFCFSGFLPVKSGRKESILKEAIESPGTSIFFESPHRLIKTLQVLEKLAPERQICVARELTKKYETFHRGTPSEVLMEFPEGGVKGEITLLISGAVAEKRQKVNKYADQAKQPKSPL